MSVIALARPRPSLHPFVTRALALWPGLDRRALSRTHGDPARIARLVTRRTALPEESIVAMLEGPAVR